MAQETKKRGGPKRLTDEERAIRKLWRKAYRARWNALQRCTDPLHKNYKHYGGRGIDMTPEWKESSARFIADMGLPPSLSHSLDRRNNDKGYSRDNCRWILKSEQTRNTRKNIWVDVGFGIMIASDADRRLGLREGTVAAYIQKAVKKAVKPYSGPKVAA